MRRFRAVASRINAALSTPPGWRGVGEAALIFLAAGVIIAPLGLAGGFLSWSPQTDLASLARIAMIAMVFPALGEELAFRAALLPRSGPQSRRAAWAAVSLAAFVAWHPLAASLWLPAARPLFLDPAFLAAAFVLGAACTIAYLRTGSIWPSVIMHWTAVVAWKALLGGPEVLT